MYTKRELTKDPMRQKSPPEIQEKIRTLKAKHKISNENLAIRFSLSKKTIIDICKRRGAYAEANTQNAVS